MKNKISSIIEGGAYQQAIIFRLEGGGIIIDESIYLLSNDVSQ